MEKQFVTYDIALTLKELGFDEPCMARFEIRTNELTEVMSPKLQMFVRTESQEEFSWQICSAPLWQQVIDWFMEKYDIIINVDMNCMENEGFTFYVGNVKSRETIIEDESYGNVNSYYDARKEAILKTIELIKN